MIRTSGGKVKFSNSSSGTESRLYGQTQLMGFWRVDFHVGLLISPFPRRGIPKRETQGPEPSSEWLRFFVNDFDKLMHIKIGGDTKQEDNLEDRTGTSQASGSQQNESKLMTLLLIRKI